MKKMTQAQAKQKQVSGRASVEFPRPPKWLSRSTFCTIQSAGTMPPPLDRYSEETAVDLASATPLAELPPLRFEIQGD